MGILGRGKTTISYTMFDLARSADEAKRFHRCERIYHKGQNLAWDGKDILASLIAEHGGVHIDPDKRDALKRIFAIILWGELAAWKISAQLADRLEPLEAKMAATSQAHDEARHFYTMYDYLQELGYVPARLDPAPQALLDLVLETDDLAYKLLGMQMLIETIALAIFQEVRESKVEPVLCGLMAYYERDEARHVGLGMQYLPSLMRGMSPLQGFLLILFQARLVTYALWEHHVLQADLEALGIDQRRVLERARDKQMVALREAFAVLGVDTEKDRNVVMQAIAAIIEVVFPPEENRRSYAARLSAAWRAFTTILPTPTGALDVHASHAIRTARGEVAPGEDSVFS